MEEKALFSSSLRSWRRKRRMFLNAFFVPLRSTQKAFKNIVLYLDLIFYRKWVTSIYNADPRLVNRAQRLYNLFKIWYYDPENMGMCRKPDRREKK